MKTKNAKISLKALLIMSTMIPLFTALIVLTIVNIASSKNNLEEHTQKTLIAAATGLRNYYEPFYHDGREIEYDTSIVDSLTGDGIELTLFKGDVRFATSIKGSDGNRIEGTQASAAIWAAVQKGQNYYADGVKINNKNYYVYYMPLTGPDGTVLGMAFAGISQARIDEQNAAVTRQALVISLVLAVVFVAICLYFTRKVINPIHFVAKRMEDISEGNLRGDGSEETNIKETRLLIDSAQNLQDKLISVMESIHQKSKSLDEISKSVANTSETASEETGGISRSMEDLAQGASSLAENVQDIAQQIVTMGQDITSITESTDTLAQSAKNMNAVSKDAASNITMVSETSAQSVEKVKEINSQIGQTNDAINRIDQAVEMIASIASQTNLLALNASIEAARAGEAGRGFAVVADEINSLSTQSSENASAIAEIVSEIKTQSTRTVELSEQVNQAIEREREIVDETKAKFDELNNEISSSTDAINGIVGMIERVNTAKDSISSSVEDLSAVSEENAASNEEVSASLTTLASSIEDISGLGKSISEESDELASQISFFKL